MDNKVLHLKGHETRLKGVFMPQAQKILAGTLWTQGKNCPYLKGVGSILSVCEEQV